MRSTIQMSYCLRKSLTGEGPSFSSRKTFLYPVLPEFEMQQTSVNYSVLFDFDQDHIDVLTFFCAKGKCIASRYVEIFTFFQRD